MRLSGDEKQSVKEDYAKEEQGEWSESVNQLEKDACKLPFVHIFRNRQYAKVEERNYE